MTTTYADIVTAIATRRREHMHHHLGARCVPTSGATGSRKRARRWLSARETQRRELADLRDRADALCGHLGIHVDGATARGRIIAAEAIIADYDAGRESRTWYGYGDEVDAACRALGLTIRGVTAREAAVAIMAIVADREPELAHVVDDSACERAWCAARDLVEGDR